jgi:hypothetical protein
VRFPIGQGRELLRYAIRRSESVVGHSELRRMATRGCVVMLANDRLKAESELARAAP